MNLSGVQVTEQQADLLDNQVATSQTVRRMCELIAESVGDEAVMACVRQAVAPSDLDSRQRIAAGCWDWCKRNIEFVPDDVLLFWELGIPPSAEELERLASPAVLARMRKRQGDCDDFVMMLCAMVLSVGVPPAIKTFKCDHKQPWRWSHVCAGVILEDGSLFPLDASHGDYPGWQVPIEDTYESCVWDMNGNPIAGGSNGMGFTRRGGMGAYQAAPGWTGNPMYSVTGPEAGPYSPVLDIRKYYQKCNRAAGLGYIARRGRGMGETVVGPDGVPIDVSTTYSGDGTGGTYDTSSYGTSNFNLNSFLSSVIGAGTKIGTAALGQQQAQNLGGGKVLLPSGQIISTSSGISTGLIVAAVLGIGLLFALKK